MESLSLWSETDTDLLLLSSAQSDSLEVDNLSPTLALSATPHFTTADFLLDDISLDCAPQLQPPPTPPPSSALVLTPGDQFYNSTENTPTAQQQQHLLAASSHSHDGLRVCEFSTATCPMNPYGHDPIIGDPLLQATPGTVAALRGAVTRSSASSAHSSPTSRMTGRRGAQRASPLVYRQPPPYPGLLERQQCTVSQAATAPADLQYYDELLPQGNTASPLRVVQPRLKVARRLATSDRSVLSSSALHHHVQQRRNAHTAGYVQLPQQSHHQPSQRTHAVSTVAARVSLANAECKHTKPNLSYVNLITLALLNSPAGSLRCNEIYDFLQRVFPYFREVNTKTWKNDTRHALSSNQSSSNFCKAPETKTPSTGNRGALWMAKPEKMEFLHEHLAKTYYKFADNIREAMGSVELYDELMMVVQQGCSGSTYLVLDVASPCAQSPTVGSTTDSPDGF